MTAAESEDLPAALKEQVVGMGEQGYAPVEGAVLNRHGLQPLLIAFIDR
jgi:hypothetical protein